MSPRAPKTPTKVPTLPPVDSWPRALAWLREHKSAWKSEWKTAQEAMFWFVSYQQADMEGLRRKDVAWFFLHGIPKASVKECKGWIADQKEEWNEGGDEPMDDGAGAYDLRHELEDFWGVKS